jgi:hypothetical protein
MDAGNSSSTTSLLTKDGNNSQVIIQPGAGRPLLDRTQQVAGHPLSNLGQDRHHQYPHPKNYKNKAEYLGNTTPVYEELIKNSTTYHHRFQDPLAFENRYRDLYTAAPNVFRKPKPTPELRCVTADMYGNPITRLPHLMRPRTKPNTPVDGQSLASYAPGTGAVTVPFAQSPMSTGEFNSRQGKRLLRASSTPLLGASGKNSMSRGASSQGQYLEAIEETQPISKGLLESAFNEAIDIDELVASRPIPRSQRLTKSASLPRLKRPKWQRLAKSNLGFPPFTTELRKQGPYKVATA